MREADLEKRLKTKIESVGGICWKFISPNCRGVPDRIIIMPTGKVLFVELKTDKGVVAPLQQYRIDKLRALGCDARIIRGRKGVDELLEELHAI